MEGKTGQRPQEKNITIYDIAREAGVSSATVSRVINGSDRVSDRTRQRIEAIMQEKHFVVNASAKSLVKKQTNSIGVLVPDLHNIHYLDAAEVVGRFFENNGMTCIVSAAGEDPLHHAEVLRLLAEKQVDGLVLVSSFFKNDQVKKAIEDYFQEIPVLMIYARLDLPNVISAFVDEEQAAREATELLIARGHDRLVFVKRGDSSSIRHKCNGFVDACDQSEGTIGRQWNINAKDFDGIMHSIRAMFKTYPDTNGIVFNDDYLATAGGRVIAELGYRVPEEMAYVSFFNCGHAYMANPPITSVDTRVQDLAEMGCNLMMEAFDIQEPYARVDLPYRIVERATT